MEWQAEFENWFLSLDSDYNKHHHLSIHGNRYYLTHVNALYQQFCEIKRLKNEQQPTTTR